jgi:F-type H+-transporting ATPase subunit delta
MSERASFARHARVLLDASRGTDPDRVSDDLDAFAALLRDHMDIARPLLSGGVDAGRKADAVRAIGRHAGFTPVVAGLLVRLAERHQLAIVPGLAAAVRARLLEQRNVVSADVMTAVPLTEEQRAAMARRLGEVTGKDVRVTSRVDPSILGGVVTRIGSMVYDGSITRRLARMRQKLVENV